MAMRGFVLLCLVISMDVLGAAAGVLQPPPMFVFGDSTLDVGNNNYLHGAGVPRANMPYYGIDFPGVPAGRFSNGDNIADFLAKSIGLWSSPPPYLFLEANPGLLVSTALEIGVSYASGGSGILDCTNAGYNIPLSKQVQYFSATMAKMITSTGDDAAVSTLLARSVFLISDGNNDLSAFTNAEAMHNRSPEQQQSDAAAFLAGIISNYSAAITELHAMGARKFAIINAGLIGCVPAARAFHPLGECAGGLNQLAAGFNAALSNLLPQKKKKLRGLDRLLPRRLLQPHARHLRRPSCVGVHRHCRRVLRHRLGALHVHLQGLLLHQVRARPALLLGSLPLFPAGLFPHGPGILQWAVQVHYAHQLQAAGCALLELMITTK